MQPRHSTLAVLLALLAIGGINVMQITYPSNAGMVAYPGRASTPSYPGGAGGARYLSKAADPALAGAAPRRAEGETILNTLEAGAVKLPLIPPNGLGQATGTTTFRGLPTWNRALDPACAWQLTFQEHAGNDGHGISGHWHYLDGGIRIWMLHWSWASGGSYPDLVDDVGAEIDIGDALTIPNIIATLPMALVPGQIEMGATSQPAGSVPRFYLWEVTGAQLINAGLDPNYINYFVLRLTGNVDPVDGDYYFSHLHTPPQRGIYYPGRQTMEIPIQAEEVNLYRHRNEHINLDGTVTDDTGALVDMTGGTVRWILTHPDGTDVITKTITEISTTAGIIQNQTTNRGKYLIKLAPADTAALEIFTEDGTIYTHSAKYQDAAGEDTTVTVGEFRFARERQSPI